MSDTDTVENPTEQQLKVLLRDVHNVADQLPEPLNLDRSIIELQKTIETTARLESQRK
ncbi:hypothetical protein Htur_4804 (plasmid) [Haloterrigena turkmenica DSM 5511]|uniref:Uncharacterized protein n=1 Tax=Haloterrigena turkmenica (strain ATCC 51198 / DSM 5511 / JCM 9101 / NCIMB 13204 / VKM B-1734 / 4k) TaxID=543526 RepID=D2S2H6_HALTV|nr:hypothetical protein [Haloterrigena turkmenica]ADB63573.1 hypothetical protein Htur_4804 [Haloterrigena turkmenica DSM 5511]